MNKYQKIYNPFIRDRETKQVLHGQWSLPEFEYLQNNEWIFTEKIDGTNIRVLWNNGVIQFRGKTDEAEIYQPLLDRLHEIFDGKNNLFEKNFGNSEVCIYGEGYGDRIQKVGKLYADGDYKHNFRVFDIKIGNWWLTMEDIIILCTELGLSLVPVFGVSTLNNMISFCSKFPQPISGIGKNCPVEGYVGTPIVPLNSRNGERVIVKVKYKDFARKQEQ